MTGVRVLIIDGSVTIRANLMPKFRELTLRRRSPQSLQDEGTMRQRL